MKEGWKNLKIKDIADVIAGQSPEGKYYNTNEDGYAFHQGKKDFGETYLKDPNVWTSYFTKLALTNDILMSVRAPVGPVNITPYDCCIGRGLAAIRCHENHSMFYLFNYLKYIGNNLIGNSGAVFNSINKKQIEDITIPIPPLAEQEAIVAKLDEAFAVIDQAKANLERNIANAKELFQAKLNQIFSQKGEDWEEKKLGEVCKLYQGLAINSKTKHFIVENSTLPLLRIKDLKNNTQEIYINENLSSSQMYVDYNDIIYTRTGSLGLVFRNRRGILHNNSFKIVQNETISSDYLFIWLQNPIFNSTIISLARRAAQPDITHKIFNEQVITFPKSLKKQEEIVQQLDQLAAQTKQLEICYKQKLDNLEELRKSILEKAFKGELV